MSNPSKAKGTAAESAVVAYFRSEGYPHVERRALHGANDKGDIAGLPCVIEVKACKTFALAEWVDEATVEAVNAGADFGVVFAKRRGRGSPRDWYVVMTGATFVDLLRKGTA